MTEPTRPPGDGTPPDPAAPTNPYSADPASGPAPAPPPPYGDTPPPAYGSPPPPSGAGGYGPPPTSGPGGYGPPPGYGPYGAPGAPAGYADNDEKTWALIAHFGGIVVGFIAPLVALLAKGNESPAVRAHSVEALNFQITWGVATIVASILAVCSLGILFFLPMLTWVVVIVFSIIGGMKASEGVLYRYPMTFRLVK
jgi:uncharacterized protein